MNKEMKVAKALSLAKQWQECGSRVTCTPAPMNTDKDYILLVDTDKWQKFNDYVSSDGWELGGSNIPDENNILPAEKRFLSFTYYEHNLIVTRSEVFYKRFIAATYVAKRLNLLVKADRIALFQAVLYANIYE